MSLKIHYKTLGRPASKLSVICIRENLSKLRNFDWTSGTEPSFLIGHFNSYSAISGSSHFSWLSSASKTQLSNIPYCRSLRRCRRAGNAWFNNRSYPQYIQTWLRHVDSKNHKSSANCRLLLGFQQYLIWLYFYCAKNKNFASCSQIPSSNKFWTGVSHFEPSSHGKSSG